MRLMYSISSVAAASHDIIYSYADIDVEIPGLLSAKQFFNRYADGGSPWYVKWDVLLHLLLEHDKVTALIVPREKCHSEDVSLSSRLLFYFSIKIHMAGI